MSFEATTWVLKHAPESGTEKVILIGIASHADEEGENAWPSVETLAKYARVSERNVQRALRRLAEAGAIVIEPQAGGKPETRDDRRPNRYRVVMTRGDVLAAPSSPNGVTSVTPRGDVCDAHGVTPAPPELSLELSKREPSKRNARSNGSLPLDIPPSPPKPAASKSDIDEEFEEWWKAYPRKADKIAARKAYRKLRKEKVTAEELLAGVVRYRSKIRREGTESKYVKHPSTFLNAGSWADEEGDIPASAPVTVDSGRYQDYVHDPTPV